MSSSIQPSAADTAQNSAGALSASVTLLSAVEHFVLCRADGNWNEAVALLPELESAMESADAALATKVEVTEAQVVAFLEGKARELAAATGVSYAYVRLAAWNPAVPCLAAPEWQVYVDGSKHFNAATPDEAIAELAAHMAPEKRASYLREKAKAMLQEAEQIAPSPLVA